MDSEPWDYYSRAAARAGWTLPVGQTRVREALALAGTRVRYLSLGGGYDGGPFVLVVKPRPRSAIRAWWSTDTAPNRRAKLIGDGTRRGWAGLDVYAVQSGQAAAVRELLENDLLDQAAEWIAAIDDRGDGWQASDHQLIFFIGPGGVRRTES